MPNDLMASQISQQQFFIMIIAILFSIALLIVISILYFLLYRWPRKVKLQSALIELGESHRKSIANSMLAAEANKLAAREKDAFLQSKSSSESSKTQH